MTVDLERADALTMASRAETVLTLLAQGIAGLDVMPSARARLADLTLLLAREAGAFRAARVYLESQRGHA